MNDTQLRFLTTALADRYRVVREIGRGGMATVYLAEDPRHRRQVAIKVFNSELAEVLGRDRFLREIELTAGLTHPHILPLYDSGLADGLAYYVMPFVEGKTLREQLSERGRLPLDEALRIVKGVAEALAFAHRKGIVHRDIKPENVLLQGGHALVADFGIARALSLAGDAALTQTGMIVGTPSYMSPEQTVGDAGVDARSDIYSLGCLLFEALTGWPPFRGGSPADIARRRLTETAPSVRATASGVPAAIDEAVARALAREPGDRFSTADAFAAALMPSAAPSADRPTVDKATKGLVVLPFGNLSPDPENEFFADGLTEEVIADLSGISALRVISRTSAMRFKGSDKDLKTIARELNVRYVLEGSVRRAGSSLRVTAQLIEADTDSHVWADKYSGSVEDVFAIQEEISRKIVNALQVKLTETESRKVAERPIDNAAAYDCYLRAHHEMLRFTSESLDRARTLADAGLALIGDNPLLLATRGLVSWYYLNFSIRPDERYLDEAAAFAARALDRDPGVFLGIYLRGLVAAKRGDIEGAVRDIRRACAIKPGDAATLELMRFLFTAGHISDAVLEDAQRIDPLNPLVWTQTAFARFASGRLAESEQAVRRAIGLADPGNPVRTYIACALASVGRRDEAIAILDDVSAALGDSPYGSLSGFFARALQGDADGAVRHVTPLLEQSARWVEYLAWILADGYALIGQRDRAMYWLREAVREGLINYPLLAQRDPFLESLRGEPAYETLMQQLRPRWQAFDASTRGA